MFYIFEFERANRSTMRTSKLSWVLFYAQMFAFISAEISIFTLLILVSAFTVNPSTMRIPKLNLVRFSAQIFAFISAEISIFTLLIPVSAFTANLSTMRTFNWSTKSLSCQWPTLERTATDLSSLSQQSKHLGNKSTSNDNIAGNGRIKV